MGPFQRIINQLIKSFHVWKTHIILFVFSNRTNVSFVYRSYSLHMEKNRYQQYIHLMSNNNNSNYLNKTYMCNTENKNPISLV